MIKRSLFNSMGLCATVVSLGLTFGASAEDTIKVGIMHSLSGTMAISETPLKDVALMTIDEINAKGGVLGKKLEPVVVDPASNWPLFAVILLSWGLAFFEYCFMVPANRIGYSENGGGFSLIELKVIQEVVSLTVFTLIVTFVFKGEKFHWNHIAAFLCLVASVYFAFMPSGSND